MDLKDKFGKLPGIDFFKEAAFERKEKFPDLPLEVRLTVENMRNTIVQQVSGMFQAWGDQEKIEAIVNNAIKNFDFDFEISQMVRGAIQRELQNRVGWIAADLVKKNDVVRQLEKLEKRLYAEARIELGLD